MKRVSILALTFAGLLGVAALPGGNGSGTSNGDPDRDILDLAVLPGGNGSGTSNGDPDRDILDLV